MLWNVVLILSYKLKLQLINEVKEQGTYVKPGLIDLCALNKGLPLIQM